MNATLVNNPDGSAAVLVPEDAGAGLFPTSNASPGAPGFAAQRNPFPDHDRVAAENLAAMQQQDAASWAAHSPAAPEFARVLQDDGAAVASHETLTTYNAPSAPHDAAVRSAIGSADAALQRAIAAAAAGPDPVIPGAAAAPTPGTDWLERMRAQDEALRRAIEGADAPLRPPQ